MGIEPFGADFPAKGARMGREPFDADFPDKGARMGIETFDADFPAKGAWTGIEPFSADFPATLVSTKPLNVEKWQALFQDWDYNWKWLELVRIKMS